MQEESALIHRAERQNITVDNSLILNQVNSEAIANTGDVKITTGSLSLTNGGVVIADSVQINASDSIIIDGENSDGDMAVASSLIATEALGDAGDSGNIYISTTNLSLINNGGIFASNFREGSSIIINAVDDVTLDDGFITNGGEGNAGKIEITTSNLSLTNSSQILSSTSGEGKGSSIIINASDTVKLDGFSNGGLNSSLFFSTFGSILSQNDLFSNEGEAGDIDITTSNLVLINGGGIGTVTFGDGNAGSISINTADTIAMTDGFIYNDVSSNAKGNGGDIDIATTNLSLNNNSYILADTLSQGDAGSISINAAETVTLDGKNSGIFNFTANFDRFDDFSGILPKNAGDGGNIDIATENLMLTNGSQISAQTSDEGQAGNLAINASESVSVDGLNSGLFSRTGGGADAGNVIIITPKLTVQNNAQVGVNNFIESELRIDTSIERFVRIFNPSEGSGNAGSSEIIADLVQLEDGGSLVAISAEGDGGNIDLQANELLLLRRGGNISSTAGLQSTSGSGGNINIDSTLILAFPNENNDITANAFNGIGGNINIFTQAIFGLEERPSTPPNQTNDIDASSDLGLQGDIAVNTPDFDPTTGLINLPASVGDASEQISQNPCQQGVGSQFIVTGKGGLPPNVNESLNSESARVGLIEPLPQPLSYQERGGKVGDGETGEQGENTTTTPEAVPAQGWVFNDKGQVTLTAYSTSDKIIQRSQQNNLRTCTSQVNPRHNN